MVKSPTSIRDRPSDRRKASVLADEALEDDSVTAGYLVKFLMYGGIALVERRNNRENRPDVRLNDKTVVVVPVKVRTVPIDAVALVPLVVLTERVVDAHAIVLFPDLKEEGFHQSTEEKPVAESWLDRSRSL